MFLPGVQVPVEHLHPPGLVVDIEHLGRAPDPFTAVHGDPQVGAEHHQRLEAVGEDDGLDAADAGVEDAHGENDGAGDLDIVMNSIEESRHLEEGQGRGVDHDSHVEDHLETEEGGNQQLDTSAVAELKVLVTSCQFESIVDRDEEVDDD